MARNLRLNIRYRTDAERIRRVLPPPLEMDDSPEVITDWLLVEPDDSQRSVFLPGPYYESGTFISARFHGRSGMWEVSMPLNQDWGRYRGRELDDLTKKDGTIVIQREGDHIHASSARRGKVLTRIETHLTDRPQHPRFWMRQLGYAGFRYRYSLNPDWHRSLIDGPIVELWRLNGSDGGYPEQTPTGENLPMACDVSRTTFELPGSFLDPLCEFPPLEILGVTYHEGAPSRLQSRWSGPSSNAAGILHHRLSEVDAAAFEPWALYKFDRPIFRGRPAVAAGWPNGATAFRLVSDEIDAYRNREAIALFSPNILSIEYLIDAEIHRRILPPGCAPGKEPRVMLLAIQVTESDVSTEPFNEVWLLGKCVVGGSPSWYALANIVGSGGDLVLGRDAFGYPSKQGSVEMAASHGELRISGSRLGREFFSVFGRIGGPTGPRTTHMQVIGLKACPIAGDHGATGRLVAQPWVMECSDTRALLSDSLALELPETSSPAMIGTHDPWFQVRPWRIESASLSTGTILRMPGSYAGEVPEWEPYYLERCDGCLSPEEALLGAGNDTFLAPKSIGGGNNAP